VAVFLLWCVLILVGARFRENWRASAALQRGLDDDEVGQGGVDAPEAGLRGDHGSAQEFAPRETPVPHDDDRVRVPTRSAL
jgi:hypothetical protein